MITLDELLAFLPAQEEDRIEKTISKTDSQKFGEAICAFANDFPGHRKPGYLLIGTNGDGSLAGERFADEKLMQSLLDFRDGRIVPIPGLSVARFELDAGDVLVVEVQPAHQPPVRFKGTIWIRNGARKARASEAEERILIEKRASFAQSFDAEPCFEAAVGDISQDLFLNTYLPAAFDDETLAENNRSLTHKLSSLKLFDSKNQHPTHAGLLILGINPLMFIPGGYIQYVKWGGMAQDADILNDVRFSGPLITLLQSLDAFIAQLPVRKPIEVSTLREQMVYSYPPEALRESLLNAIMHRDYQSNMPIRFYEFTDRIEITNPGGLYGQARPENFPSINDYRNPVVAESLKVLGYVNRFNRGIARVKSVLAKNGSLEPVFMYHQPTHFETILYRRADI